jgi:hypothetical protein
MDRESTEGEVFKQGGVDTRQERDCLYGKHTYTSDCSAILSGPRLAIRATLQYSSQ